MKHEGSLHEEFYLMAYITVWRESTDLLQEHTASIFTVEK
jgi:hypothetical protein